MQLYLVLSLPLADTAVTVQIVAEDIDLADGRTCMLFSFCIRMLLHNQIRISSLGLYVGAKMCSISSLSQVQQQVVMWYAEAPAGLHQQQSP